MIDKTVEKMADRVTDKTMDKLADNTSDRMTDSLTDSLTENMTQNMTDNIVMIGMPGSGKSTVGVVLAKKMGYRFVDSDLVIQEQYGKLLHELIEEHGVEGFWQIENDVNTSLELHKSVIATGGSAVYGREAMEHLHNMGTVVFLQLPFEEIAERLGDLNARGVTLMPGQTLHDLYLERTPLYEKYAHITIDCSGKSLREIVLEIAEEAKR